MLIFLSTFTSFFMFFVRARWLRTFDRRRIKRLLFPLSLARGHPRGFQLNHNLEGEPCVSSTRSSVFRRNYISRVATQIITTYFLQRIQYDTWYQVRNSKKTRYFLPHSPCLKASSHVSRQDASTHHPEGNTRCTRFLRLGGDFWTFSRAVQKDQWLACRVVRV